MMHLNLKYEPAEWSKMMAAYLIIPSFWRSRPMNTLRLQTILRNRRG